MKIIDFIPNSYKIINKLHLESRYCYSKSVTNSIKMKGKYYEFYVISYDASWFNNNCEKDNIIAYYDSEFVKVAICKYMKDKYKAFTHIDTKAIKRNGQSIYEIEVVDVVWALGFIDSHKDSVIISEKDILELNKKIILDGLENLS